MFSKKKKGLMDKKQRRKWNFEREDKKENQKRKQNRKKKGLQRQAFRGNKIKKKKNFSNCRKNNLFGPFYFYKTQAQKHRGKETKPPKYKKQTKKTSFCILASNPLFLVNFCFFKLHSFMSAKLCFAENTIKIVFLAEHSF